MKGSNLYLIIGTDKRIQNAVRAYALGLVRLAFAYFKNVPDAEDIVQDVFLAYMLKAPKFDSGEHEKAWLIRVTANKCKDYLKSVWRRKRAPMPEEHAALLQAVMALDEKYRLPVYLHYFDDLSIKDIAKLLKANASTVGTRLERGRKALKDSL